MIKKRISLLVLSLGVCAWLLLQPSLLRAGQRLFSAAAAPAIGTPEARNTGRVSGPPANAPNTYIAIILKQFQQSAALPPQPTATETQSPKGTPIATATPTATPMPTPTSTSTPPTVQPGTCLTSEENNLISLINQYRAQNGLSPIPASKSLTTVGQWHVWDLMTNHPDSGTDSRGLACTLHSWSDQGQGLWTPVCYTSDNYYASEMWNKPDQITSGAYSWYGFEIAYYNSIQVTAQDALAGWKSSPAHNAVILEQGVWSGYHWKAIGVGIFQNYAVAWFGDQSDPQGAISQCP
ncbi:MAG: CAP domain-containing protein [Anaerolineales bacterium]|jgi:uncharacterized protein YkwD